jgi:uncharacterized protein
MNIADPSFVLDAFFTAIENADVEAVAALYADDAKIWHSNDNITQNKNENLKTLSFLTKRATLRYTILERVICGDQIAQRHRCDIAVRGSGARAASQAAIFFTVRDGLVQRIDEYIDTDAVRALAALFQ